MLKIFSVLETLDDENFLNFIKKKRNQYNNLSKEKSGKKKSGKISQDNQESNFIALLIQMVLYYQAHM